MEHIDPTGKHCRLKRSTRISDGSVHNPTEILTIKRITESLGKVAYIVSLENLGTTMLFPDEIDIEE